MKVLLIDVDSKIPNLALMKISSYHKKKKNDVVLLKLYFHGFPAKRTQKFVDAKEYDVVYASCIFTTNKDFFVIQNARESFIGGTGISFDNYLDDEIEQQEPDYSIYPENDNSYGFITRGCIRNCYFCFVPKKEGKIKFESNWRNIVKHKTTFFMDNNFLAYDKHKEVLRELVDNKIKFQFNQGIDIRLVDEENAFLLSKSKYYGEFIFAFDDKKYENMVKRGLDIFQKYNPKEWVTKFYVYVHPNMKISDTIYRIEWLRKNKCLPYLMRDKDCWEGEFSDFYVDLAAYCNQPGLFKKLSFSQFLNKRHKKQERIEKSSQLYNSGMNEIDI